MKTNQIENLGINSDLSDENYWKVQDKFEYFATELFPDLDFMDVFLSIVFQFFVNSNVIQECNLVIFWFICLVTDQSAVIIIPLNLKFKKNIYSFDSTLSTSMVHYQPKISISISTTLNQMLISPLQ